MVRETDTDRARKRPGITGRGEVKGKTKRATIQKKGEVKEGNRQVQNDFSCFHHHYQQSSKSKESLCECVCVRRGVPRKPEASQAELGVEPMREQCCINCGPMAGDLRVSCG